VTRNRVDALLGKTAHEHDAVEHLAIKRDVHGAESRAADIIAPAVLASRFRYTPALGWLEWADGRWDGGDIAAERVVEVVRHFIDETEKDYRLKALLRGHEVDRLLNDVLTRVPDNELTDNKGRKVSVESLLTKYATLDERTHIRQAQDAFSDTKNQAEVWLNLLSAAKIAAITKLCRSIDGILTRTTEFDSHPDLLNCTNGVLDLRTAQLLPHDPDLLLTHMAGGPYLPGATSPLWDKALDAIPDDIKAWFQTRMGQTITGHTPDDDSLVIAVGTGENGKTAVSAAIMRAAGSYGRPISYRVLVAQPGQHPTELMDLRGLRFALLEETPEEGHLDPHRVKQTIGTPYITARHMRQNDVTFPTTHTLWINTNHYPQVNATDHGTWRRLKAMPFPYRFYTCAEDVREPLDKRGDPMLKPRLRDAPDVAAAVIAWLAQGAQSWYQNGRVSPPDPQRIWTATDTWRQGSDVGYQFATGHLVADPTAFITGEVMRRAFTTFLERHSKHPWSAQAINARLGASMAAAGCEPTATPIKSSKIRQGERASIPEAWDGTDVDDPLPGGQARIWRGVRFKTEQDRRENATRIRAVR